VEHLMAKNSELEKTVEVLMRDIAKKEVEFLLDSAQKISNIRFIGAITALNMAAIKDMAFYLRNREKNLMMVLGAEEQGKALLSVVITDDLIKAKGFNAGVIIKTIAQHIKGGGGGQPFFATAGGKEPKGLQKAIDAAREIIKNID
ncbi:MAG: DHHA1 domain-containing protein, partial [Bacteroidales bacterium]|nr:DHHA1 domain-containing protein [Bacteroidales bacterium]